MNRSFVRRGGRITTAQQRALDNLWSRYGVANNTSLNLDELFGRTAEKHLEIGFGKGDALLNMAKNHPEHDYLGIDVHRPGIGHLLLQIEKAELTNVRVLSADVVEVFQNCLPAQCLNVVYLFFPDPWPKKRHQKRRLIQPNFIRLLAQLMKAGGDLYLATDWEEYAQQMLEVLEDSSEFNNGIAPKTFAPRSKERLLTRFEQRGLRLGHKVWDLLYHRQ